MAEAGKILRIMVEKSQIALSRLLIKIWIQNALLVRNMVDRENLYYLREYLTHYKWSVIRNTNIKGDAGEELVERK